MKEIPSIYISPKCVWQKTQYTGIYIKSKCVWIMLKLMFTKLTFYCPLFHIVIQSTPHFLLKTVNKINNASRISSGMHQILIIPLQLVICDEHFFDGKQRKRNIHKVHMHNVITKLSGKYLTGSLTTQLHESNNRFSKLLVTEPAKYFTES